MPDSVLYAPWRMSYIKSLVKPDEGVCFLCRAAEASTDTEKAAAFVLWQTDLSVVLLNRYPYANGHLMVAPRAHLPDIDLLTAEQQADLMHQTAEVVKVLRRAVSAQGFNIGINLGRCAGAGVPGHLHQHIVPRWGGDVSFMQVVGETRIVPDALSKTYQELKLVCDTMKNENAPGAP